MGGYPPGRSLRELGSGLSLRCWEGCSTRNFLFCIVSNQDAVTPFLGANKLGAAF